MIQEYRETGIQEHRDTGILEYKNTGIQGYLNTRYRIQGYLNTRYRIQRYTGIYGCRKFNSYRDTGIQRFGILYKVCLT